ncbi:alpha/beta fold hydrolase [Gordonia effusa]|uniref:alpha/beta fold hydrolase n=1 Tax=Gordonia effusa TaxID=263908 RepID=UPI0006800CAB|nr:alpha/beta hydrolase [Gordonia effusa]
MIPQHMVEEVLTDVDVVDDGNGPVVALAHGAGGGVRENFGSLIDSRRERFRFVGPYYPGTASTPNSEGPLDISTLADQVVAAGIRAGGESFPVVGLSLGAAVAVTAAARHPEHVSALVLTVGLAHPEAQSAAFTQIWRTLAAHEEWETLAALMIYSVGTESSLATISAADYAATVEAVRSAYPAGGSWQAELASRTDVTALFEDIDVPVLVVVGGQDRIILPNTARSFSAISGARVIEYPDAGHIFTPAQSTRWADDVFDFIDQL